MGAWGIGHWLVLLVIVLLVFGTKKIGNIGTDLSKVVRDFKKGMNGDDDKDAKDKDGQRLKADEPAASSTSSTPASDIPSSDRVEPQATPDKPAHDHPRP